MPAMSTIVRATALLIAVLGITAAEAAVNCSIYADSLSCARDTKNCRYIASTCAPICANAGTNYSLCSATFTEGSCEFSGAYIATTTNSATTYINTCNVKNPCSGLNADKCGAKKTICTYDVVSSPSAISQQAACRVSCEGFKNRTDCGMFGTACTFNGTACLANATYYTPSSSSTTTTATVTTATTKAPVTSATTKPGTVDCSTLLDANTCKSGSSGACAWSADLRACVPSGSDVVTTTTTTATSSPSTNCATINAEKDCNNAAGGLCVWNASAISASGSAGMCTTTRGGVTTTAAPTTKPSNGNCSTFFDADTCKSGSSGACAWSADLRACIPSGVVPTTTTTKAPALNCSTFFDADKCKAGSAGACMWDDILNACVSNGVVPTTQQPTSSDNGGGEGTSVYVYTTTAQIIDNCASIYDADGCRDMGSICTWDDATGTCIDLETTTSTGTSAATKDGGRTSGAVTTGFSTTGASAATTSPYGTTSYNAYTTAPPSMVTTGDGRTTGTGDVKPTTSGFTTTGGAATTTSQYPQTTTGGAYTTMSPTGTNYPATTRPSVVCTPTTPPVIAINMTKDTTFYTSQWVRMTGAVAAWWCDGRDMAYLATLTWHLNYADGTPVSSLSSDAQTTGRALSVPPYNLQSGALTITLKASYNDDAKFTVLTSTTIKMIAPTPTLTIAGGDAIAIGVSQTLRIAANLMVPCDGTSNANLCAASAVGLRRLECATAATSTICGKLSWACASVGIAGGSCDKIAASLRTGGTILAGLELPVGTYRITGTYAHDSTTTVKATQTITVTEGYKPSISINCVGRFTTEKAACTATANRTFTITWAVDGTAQTATGHYFTFPISQTTRSVVATATTADGITNTASFMISPVMAVFECSATPSTATGLKTSIVAKCNVATNGVPTEVTYGYLFNNNETVLTPIARATAATTEYSFVAPPINGDMRLVARFWSEGRVIYQWTAGSSIRVSYTVSSDDVADLKQVADEAKSSDPATAIATATTLSTISQSSSASTTTKRDIASSVIDTVGAVLDSASSVAALSPPTVVMATSAVTSAIQSTSSSSSSSSTLSKADTTKAIDSLTQLAPIAAAHGGEETRDALLQAANTLGNTMATAQITQSVAVAVMNDAPADGSVVTSGSGSTQVAAARFTATDAGGRTVTIGGSGAVLPDGFKIAGASESDSAGITAVTTPRENSQTSTPPPTGTGFASDVTNFNVYNNGVQIPVTGADGIQIRLTIDSATATTLAPTTTAAPSSSAADAGIQLMYYNEATRQWSTNGVTTTGLCPDSTTQICGTTTHFTAFVVVQSSKSSSSDDDDNKNLGIIVGVIVGVIVLGAIIAIIVMKTRSSNSAKKAYEEDYDNGNVVPLSEIGHSPHNNSHIAV